jgi:APA family basic amino acid/polyamine antiporter
VIAAVVVGTLITVAGVGISQGSFGQPTGGSISGVLQASGLLFFAFAGYARMSTLGEEVKNPERVLPRVIVGTLLGVLALYALVGSALLWGLGTEALASSVAPVADLAPASVRGLVVGIAVLASLGSLMTVLAGLSRVTLAMARDGNLPKPLAAVWSVTSSPARAELSVAGIAVVLVLSVEPLWLVGASAGSVLLYYAIAHWSALRQPASERLLWRVVPWCGLVGCVVVVATLPPMSLLTTIVLAGSGMLAWTLRQWWTSRSR